MGILAGRAPCCELLCSDIPHIHFHSRAASCSHERARGLPSERCYRRIARRGPTPVCARGGHNPRYGGSLPGRQQMHAVRLVIRTPQPDASVGGADGQRWLRTKGPLIEEQERVDTGA